MQKALLKTVIAYFKMKIQIDEKDYGV